MKLIFKSLVFSFLFCQSALFCSKNNYENALKKISRISHHFGQQADKLRKIKFLIQKYAIQCPIKTALLSKIEELERKLSMFDNFMSMESLSRLFEGDIEPKFEGKTTLIGQLTTSIDDEIKEVELVASNLLKISFDGICPNLNLNYQEQLTQNYKNNLEDILKDNQLVTLSVGDLLINAGKTAVEVAVVKGTETVCDKAIKVLTPKPSKSCWATPKECKKHWVYLFLDLTPTTNNFRSESAYWCNLHNKLEQLNIEGKILEKIKLINQQKALLKEQSELTRKLTLSGNIKLLEKQIKETKIPVNTHVEEQLILAFKRIIDFRLDQIHCLNARKSAGLECSKEIEALEAKISQLKSAVAAERANL